MKVLLMVLKPLSRPRALAKAEPMVQELAAKSLVRELMKTSWRMLKLLAEPLVKMLVKV